MRNFIKQEGIFIFGTLMLALLVGGASYAEQSGAAQTYTHPAPATGNSDVLHTTISTSTLHIGQSVPAVRPATANSPVPPASRSREREYDGD